MSAAVLPTGDRGRPWAGLVLAFALVVAPSVYWRGGVVEEEAVGFLRHHWSDLSFAQKVFDPRGWDFYQGRELSYAIDWVDAQWVRALLERDVLFFVPPSATLALLAMVAAFWFLVPRVFPRLRPATAWAVLLLYLSSFAVMSTTGILYRATKPLVAPLLMVLLLLALGEHRQAGLARGRAFALMVAGGTIMSLLDRQGLFYLLCLTGVLAVAWMLTRRGASLIAGGAAAIVLALLYNYALGPWLILRVNGYRPSMSFQEPSPWWLVDPVAWKDGFAILGDWTSTLGGAFPGWLLGLVALAVALAAWWRLRDRVHPVVPVLVALGAIAQVAMVVIMVRRHEPVTWIDHRVWYYPLPYQALLAFLLLWALERSGPLSSGRVARLAPVVLLLLVVSNVAHWPAFQEAMQSGPWFGPVSRQSVLFKTSLRTGVPSPAMDGDYRRFLFECRDRFPLLAARMAPHVSEASGIGMTTLVQGRLFAISDPRSQLAAWAPVPGRYRLEGALRLRPHQAVAVTLDGASPRELGTLSRDDAVRSGPVPFAWEVDLPAGPTAVLLDSKKGARGPRPRGRPRAFGLLLPFELVPVRAGEAQATATP